MSKQSKCKYCGESFENKGYLIKHYKDGCSGNVKNTEGAEGQREPKIGINQEQINMELNYAKPLLVEEMAHLFQCKEQLSKLCCAVFKPTEEHLGLGPEAIVDRTIETMKSLDEALKILSAPKKPSLPAFICPPELKWLATNQTVGIKVIGKLLENGDVEIKETEMVR